MDLHVPFPALFLLVSAFLSFPADSAMIKEFRYRKVVSNDMRAPDGISSFYAPTAPKTKWPKGMVYWDWDPSNTFTATEKEIIAQGFKELETVTCLQFSQRTNQAGYLNLINDGAGCWAVAYYQGTKQDVNMDKTCFGDTSTFIHEVMHALGFHHEQTRYDRDMILEIQWDNIDESKKSNFDKYPRTYAYPKYPYDLFSVMQYFLTAFAKKGRPAMVLNIQLNGTIDEYDIGGATKMSQSDVARIRSAYGCSYDGEGGDKPNARNLLDRPPSQVARVNFF